MYIHLYTYIYYVRHNHVAGLAVADTMAALQVAALASFAGALLVNLTSVVTPQPGQGSRG